MDMASIHIKATSVGGQPIISVLEGNLDFDEVSVNHQSYEVKSFIPLDFLITAVSNHALREFLLGPMVGPVAEKWKKAIGRFLHPVQPFNLVIDVTQENFRIEAPLGTSHNITSDIWKIILQMLDVLKKENLQQKITKVRFVPGDNNELLVFCYVEDKPELILDLEKEKSSPIPLEKLQFAGSEETETSSLELFEQTITKMSNDYRAHFKSD